MEGKVILLDASGVEIGETYTRRARQLVKQQRAIWADDTHTAIQFAPDSEEEWGLPPEPKPTPPPTPDKSGALYAIAAKRIQDRRRMIMHSLLFIPGFFLIWMFSEVLSGWRLTHAGHLGLGFVWGVWTMIYFYRLRTFIKEYGHKLSPRDWEGRRRLRLEAEVDRLKRMGFSE